MNLSLFLVLVSAVGLQGLHDDSPLNPTQQTLLVAGADQPIFASTGEEVILNCSVESHQPVHEIEEVTWKKKDGDLLVLLFQDNKTFSDSSHENYQGRSEFFITEIPKGNFSLKLKDVRLEDKGEFICEIHSSNMSARTIVVLQRVGFSVRHISTLLLCFVALLITVGFSFSTVNMLRKKITNRKSLMTQAALMLCPNICMCLAFMLWIKEGFLHEVVTCSAVCFARPIMLLRTSPYLNTLPRCLQKAVKVMAVPLPQLFLIMSAYSAFLKNFSEPRETFAYGEMVIAVVTVLCFIGTVVLAGLALRVHLIMILETFNALLVAVFIHMIEDFNLNLQIILVLPPLLMALMIILFIQRHCIQRKPFKCLQTVLLSFMVILYSSLETYVYVVREIEMRKNVGEWPLLFEAALFIIAWSAVVLLLHCCRKKCCSLQRGKGYLCCAVVASVLITVFGISCLYYTAKGMEARKDRTGYITLTILIHVLAVTALFKQPKHLPDLLHIVVYMFGTVGLTVMNSITLASELILIAAPVSV